jgi:hypothetical protein
MRLLFISILGLFCMNSVAFGQKSGSSVYIDSLFNYQVSIPQWLHLKEPGSSSIIGGTLPAVEKIEDAIIIQGFPKSDFKSFEEFKDIYLTGNVFGKPAKFSQEHIWYGQNELVKIDNGVRQKVFLFWNNRIYHKAFVLIETKSAYLWIQFGSTPKTYDLNISKFDEFMNGLKVIV